VVSAGSSVMRLSSPRMLAAMRTLRTNGDAVAERRIITMLILDLGVMRFGK
jgi:hypothetical protein